MWKSANQGMKTRSRSQKSDDPGSLEVFSVMLRWSGYMIPGYFPCLCCAWLDYGVSAVWDNVPGLGNIQLSSGLECIKIRSVRFPGSIPLSAFACHNFQNSGAELP